MAINILHEHVLELFKKKFINYKWPVLETQLMNCSRMVILEPGSRTTKFLNSSRTEVLELAIFTS